MTTGEWRAVFGRLAEMLGGVDNLEDLRVMVGDESVVGVPPRRPAKASPRVAGETRKGP